MSARPAKKNHPPDPGYAANSPLSGKSYASDDLDKMSCMLKNLHKMPREEWIEDKKRLWNIYLEIRQEFEIEGLSSRGIPPKKAQKLVQTAWVRRSKDSGALLVEKLPSEVSSAYVRVILVNRNGSFEVEADIRSYLDDHPLLSLPKGQMSDPDDKAYVLRALEEVYEVEEEIGIGYKGLYYLGRSSDPGDDGEARRLGDYGYAAHWLQLLLDPNFRDSDSDEDTDWLVIGENGMRFWKLLKTAIVFGETRESRRILDLHNGEEAIQRMVTTPPGKNAGEVSEAIERMIQSYALDKGASPTALKLLRWLGSERPHTGGNPLKVDHPLWTDTMPRTVNWPHFQQLVKDAKKQIKR